MYGIFWRFPRVLAVSVRTEAEAEEALKRLAERLGGELVAFPFGFDVVLKSGRRLEFDVDPLQPAEEWVDEVAKAFVKA